MNSYRAHFLIRYLLCIFSLTAIAFCFRLLPISASVAETLVLTGGTIIDVSDFGRAESDIKDSIIIIRHGKIKAAGSRGKIKIPANAKLLDISGKYVIPGLNDAKTAFFITLLHKVTLLNASNWELTLDWLPKEQLSRSGRSQVSELQCLLHAVDTWICIAIH